MFNGDMNRISVELGRYVIDTNGQFSYRKLEEIANGYGDYSVQLVNEAKKILDNHLMHKLTGDKAWGDVGDFFVNQHKPEKVDSGEIEGILNRQLMLKRNIEFEGCNKVTLNNYEWKLSSKDFYEDLYSEEFKSETDVAKHFKDLAYRIYEVKNIIAELGVENDAGRSNFLYSLDLMDDKAASAEAEKLFPNIPLEQLRILGRDVKDVHNMEANLRTEIHRYLEENK